MMFHIRAQILFQFDITSEDCLQEFKIKLFWVKIMQAHKDTKRTQLEERVNMDFLLLL